MSQGHDDHVLTWTIFGGKKKVLGTAFAQPWSHLRALLTEFEVRTDKDGRLWSPARYENGAQRGKRNVQDVSCLVLDIDGAPYDEATLDRWMALEYAAHSTYSNTATDQRWRVVFPLARPVPADEWPDAYTRFVSILADDLADKTCRDASRMFYLPSCPAGGERFCHTNEGVLLDPEAYADVTVPPGRPQEAMRDVPRVSIAADAAAPAYGRKALEEEANRVARAAVGSRNDQLNRSAFSLGQLIAGGSLEEHSVRDVLTEAALMNGLEGDEIDRTISSGLEQGMKEPRGAPARPARRRSSERPPLILKHPEPEGNGRLRTDAEALLALARDGHVTGASDIANAERFVAIARDSLLWTPGQGWLEWTGKHWRRDEGAALRLAKRIGPALLYAASITRDDGALQERLADAGHKALNHSRISAAVMLARVDLALRVEDADLDSDPWLLTCDGVTVDLRTGDARPADPRDRITRNTNVTYNQEAKCPTWQAVLERVLPDREVREFMRRAAGYSLTGRTSERVLFVLYGGGRNGKSTILRALQDVLGEYAAQVSSEVFLASRASDERQAVELVGMRLVAAAETGEDRRLREAFVKSVTGQDRLRARKLYAESFDYTPECKLWLATNHQPRITGTDAAIWDRVRLVPFTQRLSEAEVDRHLPDKLHGEREGILAWAVRGCLAWQADGLRAPVTVEAATEDYRRGEDVLGDWWEESIDEVPEAESHFSRLYAHYKTWCENSGERPARKRSFGIALSERGYDAERGTGNVSVRRGIVLREGLDSY